MKDKRDIILEFHSSPDAILNALHQAGWQIIPKAAQPQRSEQQEWTHRGDALVDPTGYEIVRVKDESLAKRVVKRINTALATERRKLAEHTQQAIMDRLKLSDEYESKLTAQRQRPHVAEGIAANYYARLLSALAAIEHFKTVVKNAQEVGSVLALTDAAEEVRKLTANIDLSLLHAHDAEVRKPLVDLLGEIRVFLNRYRNGVIEHAEATSMAFKIDDALAKLKEKP